VVAFSATLGLLFLLFWWRVLLGENYLIGGGTLNEVLPWALNGTGHIAANGLVGDTMLQMLAWQEIVGAAYSHGSIPVWDQFSYSGTPLLANYQSAPFSLFTWFALPFSAAQGLSLAMLAKICVAGLGMGLFLRGMGARTLSAMVAGVAYAGCSYMTVWLGWPNSSVAAVAPWTFAFAERFLVHGDARSLAGFALAEGMEFLAGHPETCAHMNLALGMYVLLRCIALRRRGVRALLSLILGWLIGAAMASVQIVPFLAWLEHIHGVASRTGLSREYLQTQTLMTWLVPNGRGNPGIDHNTLAGLPPNYNESTGFVGVGALVLAAIAVLMPDNAGRSRAIGLGAIVALGAGVVYGPLTPVMARLPVYDASANWRMTSVMCLAVAALAGLGFDTLLNRPPVPTHWVTNPLFALGTVALMGLGWMELDLLAVGSKVDTLLPAGPGRYIGFWLAVAALSALTAIVFAALGLLGRSRAMALGFSALVTIEALLFAVPYNPVIGPADVVPVSSTLAWLQRHAGERAVAATGSVFPAESATLYRLHDVRGYQAGLIDERHLEYWAKADPGFNPITNRDVALERPDARWLAAAGVAYVLTPESRPLAGTEGVYTAEGVTIAAVPKARPFAFAGAATVPVRNPQEALRVMAKDPLRIVAVEGSCCHSARDAGARVWVRKREATEVSLDVTSRRATRVVVLQSFSPGWTARLDGTGVAIQPADVLFQSVRVPAGRHTLVLRYDAPGLSLGFLITGCGLLALILLWFTPEIYRRLAERLHAERMEAS
jgi:hypothetical protein